MGNGVERVRIIHETDPEKYFPALFELDRQTRIALVGSHRYSVVKEWIRSWRKERKPLQLNTRLSVRDLRLRLRLATISGEIVILGFAPWDWRVAVYSMLARKNTVIYHTSWPYWGASEVPRQYGPLTNVFRGLWLRFLNHPNVHVVAVLDATRIELRERYGVAAEVIPHAVPECFFDARRVLTSASHAPVRLIYVGGLLPIKGVDRLLALMDSLAGEPVELTIIGEGPMRDECVSAAARNPAIHFLGPVLDRVELAEAMADHDALVLLSRKELFGIVIAEAMAAGLGVIATNNIGPRSLLEDADLQNLFDDGDLAGPADFIRRLAADRGELNRFLERHTDLADGYRIADVADRWAQAIAASAPRG